MNYETIQTIANSVPTVNGTSLITYLVSANTNM